MKNLLGHPAGKICSSVGVVPADILSQNISQELTSNAKDLGKHWLLIFAADGHLSGGCKVEAGDKDPTHCPQAQGKGDHGVTKPAERLSLNFVVEDF